MAAVLFTDADRDNLEMVRQIVLRRLKADPDWRLFDYIWDTRAVAEYVAFQQPRLHDRFVVLANEVMWQLTMQGVITPGLNAANPTLPHFRITSYGTQVLEEGRLGPHDPAGYLKEVRAAAKTHSWRGCSCIFGGGASLLYSRLSHCLGTPAWYRIRIGFCAPL